MSTQKTVLITGCSAGGIGDALAQEFHKRGLRVIATARRMEAMAPLAAAGIITLELDVTVSDSVTKAREEIVKLSGGKLDILVNNAGQGGSSAATDFDIEAARALFEVNLFGPMQMVKSFIDLLIASDSGHIIQIGSIAGVVPLAFGSTYNASKAALHSYGNTLRVELAPFGVKVTTVITGGVNTNISRPSSIPVGSLYHRMDHLFQSRRIGMTKSGMDPKVYAKTVVDEALCKRPRAWLWAGQFSWVMWSLDTFFGRRIFDFIMARRFGLSDFAAILRSDKPKTD